jgi:hypothetical protein
MALPADGRIACRRIELVLRIDDPGVLRVLPEIRSPDGRRSLGRHPRPPTGKHRIVLLRVLRHRHLLSLISPGISAGSSRPAGFPRNGISRLPAEASREKPLSSELGRLSGLSATEPVGRVINHLLPRFQETLHGSLNRSAGPVSPREFRAGAHLRPSLALASQFSWKHPGGAGGSRPGSCYAGGGPWILLAPHPTGRAGTSRSRTLGFSAVGEMRSAQDWDPLSRCMSAYVSMMPGSLNPS